MPRQWEYSALESSYDDDDSSYILRYTLHQTDGAETNDIYDGDDGDIYSDTLSQYIALLGVQGWEAISTLIGEEGEETWHFKRAILSSNEYIDFS